MTVTQTCILIWAVLGMISVAILLHFLRRGDERGSENRELFLSSEGLASGSKPPKNSKKN
jgi:hypothetical protein